MVNPQKIITMTKLALYDKHEGAADRAANDYFRHDYIYRKNLGTRLSVGFAGIIILVIYWLRAILVEGADIFELNVQYYATQSILFILAILAVYSLIGTVQGTREYYLVQKRLQQYQGMLRFLENAEERAAKKTVANEESSEAEESGRENYTEKAPERERRVRRITPDSAAVPGGSSTRTLRGNGNPPDPLANVSSRALSGSRPLPSIPLNQRPASRKKPSDNRPLYRLNLNDPPK
ncbi:MAG: hypothetical protein FWF79_10460 [Defluviitaleaceae bacterium]|nr:hypothetical protein [Defluviitaleaceae bacterium]